MTIVWVLLALAVGYAVGWLRGVMSAPDPTAFFDPTDAYPTPEILEDVAREQQEKGSR